MVLDRAVNKVRCIIAPARAAGGCIRRDFLSSLARARYNSSLNGIALTFDDGPHPEYTPIILDLLQESRAHAAFFVVGEKSVQHPEIVRRILHEGHALGTHSMTHPNMRQISPRRAMAEVRNGRAAVEQIVGAAVPLFRPPMGRLTSAIAAVVRDDSWSTWLWSVDSYDWKPAATPRSILQACISAQPGDVVLLHDNLESTVEATRLLTEHFYAAGIRMLAIGRTEAPFRTR